MGLKEKVTYEYIRHVNRRTFCPVCRKSEMRVDRKQQVWRCKNCGYIFPMKRSGSECVFWFCGNCDAYLNIQDDFDENTVKHTCSTCGYENSLEKENVKGVCRDCGEILQNPEDILCWKCINARKEKSKAALLAIGKAAGLAIVALGAIWMASPINDSDDSGKQTVPPEDSDDGIEPYRTYACSECGGLMRKADDTVLVCTKCGYSIDVEDYDVEDDYMDYYSPQDEILEEPECCRACGGPYPSCMTSCKIFDD